MNRKDHFWSWLPDYVQFAKPDLVRKERWNLVFIMRNIIPGKFSQNIFQYESWITDEFGF